MRKVDTDTPEGGWICLSVSVRVCHTQTVVEILVPASDLLWVQITQSYPNRLRFWILPSPESPCHVVIDPSFQKFSGKR